MRRKAKLWLLAGVALGALAQGAAAANLALLVSGAGQDQAALDPLAEGLSERGYEIVIRGAADRAGFAEALAEVEARLPEAERLLMVFVGETRTDGVRGWLLPEGFEGGTRVDAAFGAAPLDLLLGMAAEVPGRAAVVVGSEADPAAEPAGEGALVAGLGLPEVPQGVLLIAAPVDAVPRLVGDRLLDPALTTAAALEDLPEGVAALGFRAAEPAFAAPAGAEAAAPPPPREPAAAALTVAPAEAAEADLGLDQAARRLIQERLTVLGYNTRGIDGIFGPGTRAAVSAWQGDQSLEASGFVTAEQLQLLAALAEARSAELAAAAEQARQEEEAADAAFWRTTGAGGSASDLRAYLGRYPDGVYAAEARAALERLDAAAAEEASAADREAWDAARAADRPGAYRDYLAAHPEGAFAGRAEARIAEIDAEPAREQARDAARQAEDALGLNRGSRALIEGQLAAIGYDVGARDGDFDRETRRALREFQGRQGLEPTGFVDQATVQALIVASLGLR